MALPCYIPDYELAGGSCRKYSRPDAVGRLISFDGAVLRPTRHHVPTRPALMKAYPETYSVNSAPISPITRGRSWEHALPAVPADTSFLHSGVISDVRDPGGFNLTTSDDYNCDGPLSPPRFIQTLGGPSQFRDDGLRGWADTDPNRWVRSSLTSKSSPMGAISAGPLVSPMVSPAMAPGAAPSQAPQAIPRTKRTSKRVHSQTPEPIVLKIPLPWTRATTSSAWTQARLQPCNPPASAGYKGAWVGDLSYEVSRQRRKELDHQREVQGGSPPPKSPPRSPNASFHHNSNTHSQAPTFNQIPKKMFWDHANSVLNRHKPFRGGK